MSKWYKYIIYTYINDYNIQCEICNYKTKSAFNLKDI